MNLKRLVYQLSALALLVGLVALFSRLAHGHRDANYGSYVVWGLWVAMYLFFAGVAAGSFMISTLDLLFHVDTFRGTGRVALWMALVSLGGALLSIWLDLGHMLRIWKVYLQPHFGSVMTQMVWGYSLFGLLLVAALYLAIHEPEGKRLRAVMIAGVALSLFVAGAVGALLGVEASRMSWHEGLLPVQFPVLALGSGAAALLAGIGLFGDPADARRQRQLRILATINAVLVVAKLYFVWADYSQALYGNVPQSVAAVKAVLLGSNWWAFWIIQILLGTLIPLAVLVQPRLVADPLKAGTMGVLVLISFAVARANVVFPALTVPELDALLHAFSGPRLRFEYFPSLMEWGITIGITGLVTLAFLVGTDRLPLREKEVA